MINIPFVWVCGVDQMRRCCVRCGTDSACLRHLTNACALLQLENIHTALLLSISLPIDPVSGTGPAKFPALFPVAKLGALTFLGCSPLPQMPALLAENAANTLASSEVASGSFLAPGYILQTRGFSLPWSSEVSQTWKVSREKSGGAQSL